MVRRRWIFLSKIHHFKIYRRQMFTTVGVGGTIAALPLTASLCHAMALTSVPFPHLLPLPWLLTCSPPVFLLDRFLQLLQRRICVTATWKRITESSVIPKCPLFPRNLPSSRLAFPGQQLVLLQDLQLVQRQRQSQANHSNPQIVMKSTELRKTN
jgi:hypothetical protein